MMMGDMGSFGFGMGLYGWVFTLLFWGLVILGIVAIIKWLSGTRPGASGSTPQDPLALLKKRYAGGEIDREEYEQKKQDLKD